MTPHPQSPPAGDELDLIIAITNSYVEDAKYHEPNLSSEQLYEKCRKEAIDDLNAYILAEVLNEKELRKIIRASILADPNDFMNITGDMGIYDIESRVVRAAQARFGAEKEGDGE